MTDHPFPPPPRVALPVAGSALRFPVRRRLLHRPQLRRRTPSRWATTPTASRRSSSRRTPTTSTPRGAFPYPPQSADVHHEVELAVALGTGGARHRRRGRRSATSGATRVALDMTRRDLQGEAKKLGRPWEIGKAFERSAPIGPLVPGRRDRPPRPRRR